MPASTSGMDAYLALASIRVVRKYSDEPISDAALRRILQAGRATGSSRNRQNWIFYVIRKREVLNQVAETVSSPANIKGCQVAIAVVSTTKSAFDAGRAAQNIMLAAWADGIGSCPNASRDRDETKRILGVPDDFSIPIILSIGHPAEPVGPQDDDPDAILSRIDRKPLEDIVRLID